MSSISSAVMGRNSAARTRLANFVSFSCVSPLTIATTGLPSDVVTNTALAVRSGGTPSMAQRSAIVLAPGVATLTIGRASSATGVGLAARATWRLCAYPHDRQITIVSSPIGLKYMNSWASDPPIIPTSAATATTGNWQRSKILR